jgi:membrane associated rhomboid family serine protease
MSASISKGTINPSNSKFGSIPQTNPVKQILKQSLSVIITSSIIVKALCVCCFLGYIFSYYESLMSFFSIVPGLLLPPRFHLWTLITYSFMEDSFFDLFVDWFTILLFSKMLEPLWGTIECIQFYFIVTISVAISTVGIYYVAFALSFNELFLFNIYIHGLGGLLGAFTVAIKQTMPDTIILNASLVRLRQDHLPLLTITVALLTFFIRLNEFSYVIMITLGVFIGWIYLRFFQKHKNGSRGDSSNNFIFASLFPSRVQPVVAIVANTIFNLFVKLKICKPVQKRYNLASTTTTSTTTNAHNGNTQSHIVINLPKIDNSDAERRRYLIKTFLFVF